MDTKIKTDSTPVGVYASIITMHKNLRTQLEKDRLFAEENDRIRQALDNTSTNVMVADLDHDIIYMNDAVIEMLGIAADDIRQDLPDFDVDKLMFTNIDVYYRDTDNPSELLDTMTETHESELVTGGRHFKLVANPIINTEGERLGTVVEWTDLTDHIARKVSREQRAKLEREQAAENGRIRQALDNVNGNVMITDADYNIIYMNDVIIEMMRNAETDLRKDLPNFDVDKLMGSSIQVFDENPAQQYDLLEKLAQAYTTHLKIGGRDFQVIANPVFDADQVRLGTVVEWTDRTQEVAVEQEIQNMVDSALSGDLSRRIELDGKEGFFERLSQGVNDLVDVSDRVINDTVRVLSAMAQGNLTQSIEADYQGSFGQLKNDANSTIEKLTEVIGAIRTNADSVLNGSHEIAEGNVNLSQRTEEQASSLEETASSMEQMTSTVRQNADNARQANQLASGAREQAEKGGHVVGNAIAAMGEITSSSKKIADIISVIDEIAFQTNLLALNAAVEAARAGEQGRGFAVVASEVRNLAGRSATAAKEIKELIKDSVTKVEEGSKLVDESGKTLEEIVGSVKQVSDIIAEIASAGEEQSSGIEQVNHAISQMDEMTQQNAALVEQAAAASESMGEQARDLDQLVSFFTTSESSSDVNDMSDEERRSAERPWARTPAQEMPASQLLPEPMKATADGLISNDDSEWEEF